MDCFRLYTHCLASVQCCIKQASASAIELYLLLYLQNLKQAEIAMSAPARIPNGRSGSSGLSLKHPIEPEIAQNNSYTAYKASNQTTLTFQHTSVNITVWRITGNDNKNKDPSVISPISIII